MIRPVVIVTEHPGRSVGYARIGGAIAAGLAERGWPITVVGVYGHDADPLTAAPYDLHEATDHDHAAEVLGSLLPQGGPPTPVVFIGRFFELERMIERLEGTGARRRADLRYYVAADFAPIPAEVVGLARRLDRLVTATDPARDAFERAGIVAGSIPHGVDVSIYRPLESVERDRVRAEVFGVAPGTALVGTFSRNSGNKRLDLAARVVATLAHGRYAVCTQCNRHVVAPIRPADGRLGSPAAACDRCGTGDLAAGARIGLRWQLHTEDADADARRRSQGFDIDMLIERYGLGQLLWWDRSHPFARGVPEQELAKRMAACDVHLLLSDCGGWELTMLETAACGVPNVVADAGAFGAYTRPFSARVPSIDRFDGGHRGEADIGAAVAALRRLLTDRAAHRALQEGAIDVAAHHRWARVVDAWEAELR